MAVTVLSGFISLCNVSTFDSFLLHIIIKPSTNTLGSTFVVLAVLCEGGTVFSGVCSCVSLSVCMCVCPRKKNWQKNSWSEIDV